MTEEEKLSDSESESEETTDDEISLMSRKFKKMLKKRGNKGKPYVHQKNERTHKNFKENKKQEVVCYECKKPGHIKVEYPKLK